MAQVRHSSAEILAPLPVNTPKSPKPSKRTSVRFSSDTPQNTEPQLPCLSLPPSRFRRDNGTAVRKGIDDRQTPPTQVDKRNPWARKLILTLGEPPLCPVIECIAAN